jgi:hypothetical protein
VDSEAAANPFQGFVLNPGLIWRIKSQKEFTKGPLLEDGWLSNEQTSLIEIFGQKIEDSSTVLVPSFTCCSAPWALWNLWSLHVTTKHLSGLGCGWLVVHQ